MKMYLVSLIFGLAAVCGATNAFASPCYSITDLTQCKNSIACKLAVKSTYATCKAKIANNAEHVSICARYQNIAYGATKCQNDSRCKFSTYSIYKCVPK